MMTDLTGQQFGNYRLIRLLGQGGFASVYLGQHVRIASQQAAIKILHLFAVDAQAFQQEAETTASLVHPHIVRMFDFDLHQGTTPFLVMDYAPNGSLRTHHPKGKPLPLATIIQYIKELAPALQYAHDSNIIHRDIKPENILIGRYNELLLSDFGIAMLSKTGRTSLEQSYSTGGTPYYMAPEMFRGKPERASDQYSLGILVYEWLSGTTPYTEGDSFQLGYQHIHEPIPPLRETSPSISSRVEAVVMKALAKAPKDRYPSVQAFAQALEEAGQTAQVFEEPGRNFAQAVVKGIQAPPPKVLEAAKPPRPSPPIGTRLVMYKGHTGSVQAVAWSLDGTKVASGSNDRTVQVWDASNGKLFLTYEGHSSSVYGLAWSPNGTRIASGAYQAGAVQVWDASNGKLLFIYKGHTKDDSVFTVVWSPDGTRMASSSSDNTAQVWDASNGRLLLTCGGHAKNVNSVAWSPDGRYIVSGSEDKTVQVWEATTGKTLHTYRGHTDSVVEVVWSPDGKRIASCSTDKTVQVWEATNGRLLYTYKGHEGSVYTVAWSPDGIRIASGSGDKTVQVWEAATGRSLYTYKDHTGFVVEVVWSPDGTRIASGSHDKTVQIWQAR